MIDTLVLWDIDGTLLSTGRTGLPAWVDAVASVLGAEVDLSQFPMSGLTDGMISRDLVTAFGSGPDPGMEAALLRRYVERLPHHLDASRGRLLPNVPETIEALRETGRVHQMLLTGNARSAAQAKLTAFGISDVFSDGAFCEDGFDRPAIGRVALERATRSIGVIAPSRTYNIGDTPLDIQCGHELGMRTIAIATGVHGLDELRLHRPWLASEQLPEPLDLCMRLGIG